MVLCCVPNCGSDSWRCDPSITFHDFPSNPDLAAKWIKQVNNALNKKPMWFPRGRPVMCSKHFLQTDFKPDSDALKPRCLPTVFGFKYIGANPDAPTELNTNSKKSPLIVKVLKPQENVMQNDSGLVISNVHSESANMPSIASINAPVFEPLSNQTAHPSVINAKPLVASNQTTNFKSYSNYTPSKHKLTVPNNGITSCNGTINDLKNSQINYTGNVHFRNNYKRKEKSDSDLIEIGPNTFLKINPDIIKVNKKQTPSGNTVLQFIMDQKLARTQTSDLLPKLIQGFPNTLMEQNNGSQTATSFVNKDVFGRMENINDNEPVVQHVLGHLVDIHVCQKSCDELKITEDEDILLEEGVRSKDENSDDMIIYEQKNANGKESEMSRSETLLLQNTDSSFISKAPVLMTTNVPLTHCYMEKPKFLTQLKQKSRQIASLKFKLSNLTKKIEELEDRCIVQERQLSYSFIKRLKTIRKNATKGDPCATYILEQIRGYSVKSKMRWSESTLMQCAIWCRKAPYAYEYFKKAEFFKLPCLGTVKRYMKKHPELKFQKKTLNGPNADDNESSSDFDFDESDSVEGGKGNEGEYETQVCETVLSVPEETEGSENTAQVSQILNVDNGQTNESQMESVDTTNNNSKENLLEKTSNLNSADASDKTEESSKETTSTFPITVSGSNLEVQELILPSGEIVQCYSSSLCNGADVGSQYYIIPNVSDQNSSVDHEYSVVQSESLPVILQNLENSEIPMQQEQLIFITNSSDQVECSETEVSSV